MRLSLAWLTPLALLCALALAGCSGRTTSSDAGPDDPPPAVAPEKPANAAKADAADMAKLAQGSNQFTFDLFRAVDDKGNLFLSPFTVAAAVSLNFANNDDKALARALHLDFGQDRLNTAYAGLIWKVRGEGQKRPVELDIASAVWLDNAGGFTPSEEYVKKARDNYAAPPHSLNLLREGVKEVNSWSGQKTRGKVKEILTDGDLEANSVAVLTTAVYFKGEWIHKFKTEQTRPGQFHVTSSRSVQVPMMSQEYFARYHKGDGVQVLMLPYAGYDLSLLVILPEKADGLAEVERGLSAERLERWCQGLRSCEVRLALPRFQMAGGRLELKEKLAALGLPMNAEPRIGTVASGLPLAIDKALHRGYVEVNEEGATAAVSLADVSKDKGAEENMVTFRADHPFVFLIRDNATGCVLFIGRLAEPK